jgi:hypothetical protein
MTTTKELPKNYNSRTETISVPYLTAEAIAAGYTINRHGQLKSPPLEDPELRGPVPGPAGPAAPKLVASTLMGYTRVKRTVFRDVNSGHSWHEDEPLHDQPPDGSYTTETDLKGEPLKPAPVPTRSDAPLTGSETLAQLQARLSADSLGKASSQSASEPKPQGGGRPLTNEDRAALGATGPTGGAAPVDKATGADGPTGPAPRGYKLQKGSEPIPLDENGAPAPTGPTPAKVE